MIVSCNDKSTFMFEKIIFFSSLLHDTNLVTSNFEILISIMTFGLAAHDLTVKQQLYLFFRSFNLLSVWAANIIMVTHFLSLWNSSCWRKGSWWIEKYKSKLNWWFGICGFWNLVWLCGRCLRKQQSVLQFITVYLQFTHSHCCCVNQHCIYVV